MASVADLGVLANFDFNNFDFASLGNYAVNLPGPVLQHAIVMLVAWVAFAPMAALYIAAAKNSPNFDMLFYLLVSVLTSVLTIAGSAIVFVFKLDNALGTLATFHGQIGTLTTVVGAILFLLGVLRLELPSVQTVLGRMMMVIGAVATLTGFISTQQFFGVNATATSLTSVMVVFFAVVVLLMVLAICLRGEKPLYKNPQQMLPSSELLQQLPQQFPAPAAVYRTFRATLAFARNGAGNMFQGNLNLPPPPSFPRLREKAQTFRLTMNTWNGGARNQGRTGPAPGSPGWMPTPGGMMGGPNGSMPDMPGMGMPMPGMPGGLPGSMPDMPGMGMPMPGMPGGLPGSMPGSMPGMQGSMPLAPMPGTYGAAPLPPLPLAFRAMSAIRTSVARMRGEPSYRPPNNYFLKDSLYNGKPGGGPPAASKPQYRATLASLLGNAKERGAPKAVTPMSSFERNDKLSALTDHDFPSVSQRFGNTAQSEARPRSDKPPRAELPSPPVRADLRVRAEQPRPLVRSDPPARKDLPRPPIRSDPPVRVEPRASPRAPPTPATGMPGFGLFDASGVKLKKRNGDIILAPNAAPKMASAPKVAPQGSPERSDGGGSSGDSAYSDPLRAPASSPPSAGPQLYERPKGRYDTVNIPPPPPGGPPPRKLGL
jgi:hypothetical protein